MPKTTSRSKKASSASKKSATQPKAASSNGSAEATEAKRAARDAQSQAQRQYVIEHYVDGDEKLSAVAQHLKITPGKAAFLAMQVRVERNEVPAITGKTDDALLKAINAARLKGDEYSSWGWLAARSGRSEGFIKTGLAKAGLYKPKADNVATRRAASKPKAASKTTTSGKKSGKKVSGNA